MLKADYIERAKYFDAKAAEYMLLASETSFKSVRDYAEGLVREYDAAAATARRRAEEAQ